MREAKPEWIAALRGLEGCGDADIRWNESVGRFEFILPGADGIPRSQFWGQFWTWHHGERINTVPDPVTGLFPFRDLDDAGMREALANLERTYVANRWDGSGTTQREVMKRHRFNMDLRQRKFDAAGAAFADMAAERSRRIRGAPQVAVPSTLVLASTG